ncbi:hypothetical protein TrVE_jg12622 [Triparma verrucosa]|uniref:Sulfatase N-terminal domain-containing protein n=1 Tax=Triparma verrucosa TaxID=1606542 RepID=A0A9W7BV20_9STRA|nr:hypothetical protein TrVE_jg12622 [Triparma verrucosa]
MKYIFLFLLLVVVEAKNIIHIQIDDLRTEIGAYNPNHVIHTPNIDKLAAQGVTFDRAYAQQALCNPSRASYMTGRYPDTTKIWNLIDNWRYMGNKNSQLWTSLPGMMLAAGYKSLGSGKTYHDTVQNGIMNAIFEYDSFRSWSPESLPYRNPGWTQGIDFLGCPETRWGGNVTVAWCERKTGDMSDVLTIDHAIDLLKEAVNDDGSVDTPFYLAVGLHKPHMPWIAKPEHFEMYDLDNIKVAKQKTLNGTDIPEIAFRDCDSPSPYEPLEDDDAKIARRAYYAAVTGMDEELGRFLQALEDSGAAEDTAVILHSDHGWQLGERGMWAKNTNWEAAVRVPLIMKVPWLEGTAGTRSDELAELVDIMPTIAELAEIDVPHTKLGDRLNPIEGTSLVTSLTGGKVKDAAFSQYPRKPNDMSEPWKSNGIGHDEAETFLYMGYSVRVEDWRYTEWYPWDQENLVATFDDGVYARELYDWRNVESAYMDYDEVENLNVAEHAENDEITSTLHEMILEQFQK